MFRWRWGGNHGCREAFLARRLSVYGMFDREGDWS